MTSAKMRMQQERMDVVVELGTGTMTMIDHEKKQYWQMTREDIEALSKSMSDRLAQMQKDPQAAAMMEKLMGAMGPVKLEHGPKPRRSPAIPAPSTRSRWARA